jgi:hypothetical protein
MHTQIRWGNLEGKCHLEDIGAVGRIILKWILKNRIVWTGLIFA